MRPRMRRGGAILIALAVAVVVLGTRRDCRGRSGETWSPQTSLQAGTLDIEILSDAAEFMDRLDVDLREARAFVAVQTMSFEGDGAGTRLASMLASCQASKRHVLIDSYSRFVVSDKFRLLPTHWRDQTLRFECERTRATLAELDARGVSVRLTNPMDPLLLRFMARNHKKMVVIDDRVAYLGGINFCDHNFAWRDMMIRIQSGEVAAFLREDFEATWEGDNRSVSRDFGGLWLSCLDGRCNDLSLRPIIRAMENARESIFVQSGYLTFPFIRALRAAQARGARIVLLTPELNNKPIVKDYLLWEATRAGFDINLYPGRMSHLKAVLIDDSILIAGSSNFDYVSYTVQQELLAVVTDAIAIQNYKARILEPDLSMSRHMTAGVSALGGWPGFLAMRVAAAASVCVIRILDSVMGARMPHRASEWYGNHLSLAARSTQGSAIGSWDRGVSTDVQEKGL